MNQNSIQEEIKSRLRSGNACCHSVRNILSSSLLFKNIKIMIYRTVILPVVLYGCETWSLTLREERRLRTFENRVLRRIFGPKRDEVTGEWRKLHNAVLNPLNPELNPICYLLALLGAHHFLHVSSIRVKLLTFRRLMSYIYIYIWSTHS